MKVILITPEEPYENEVEIISEALEVGLYRCHLRRPHWLIEETRAFLDSFSSEALAKIVLHDYHQLAKEYPIAGIHFNRRHPFTQRPIGLSDHLLPLTRGGGAVPRADGLSLSKPYIQ